jgi:transcriptional regulator with XRE-family HTH domain
LWESKICFTFVKSIDFGKNDRFFNPYQTMKDRIRQIMESQHMTQTTFASFIGMAPASLSSIFNERTRPTLNMVEAIKSKIPAISLDWLMFGKGPMYEDQKDGVNESTPVADTNSREQELDFTIPPAVASGGYQEGRNVQGVYRTPNNPVRNEVKYIDKPKREIVEIRVFFDDGTWESLVPKK